VVGSVSVEVIASAKVLAASLKKEVESAFKDLDFSKAIRDSIGNTKIKLPVEPDMDTSGLGEKVRRTRIPKIPVEPDLDTKVISEKVKQTRVPKVPVELDPVMAAFQQEVKRQTAALAKTVNTKIPVGADTAGMRAQLGAQIGAIQSQLKVKVPTEPGEKAAYEAKLKAQLLEVGARVKQTVQVEPDKNNTVLSRAVGGVGSAFKSLGDALPSLGGISAGISELGASIQKTAGSSALLGGNLVGAFTSALGPVGAAIALIAAATAAMTVLAGAASVAVAAISAVAGAAAAIPAAIAGGGAAFGTLALGFKGITEAFQPKTGGGGGGGGQDSAARARRIAGAERGVESARRGIAAASRALESAERGLADAEDGVTQAQARAKSAQQAVSKARVDAAKDIDDLNRSLRGAKLSEEDAALGVTEALRALNEAKLTGNLPDIQRADLSYREAVQTLDEASASTKDLSTQQADQAKKGVEGSDKVQQALQDQQDALRGVKSAQGGVLDAQNAVLSANDGLKSSYDGLKSAQDSLADSQAKAAAGAAAAAAKTIPLAASARKFVDAIKALKPAFESLRLDVQQRLFAGLDTTVTAMWNRWKDQLHATLGSFADTFNGFFRDFGASVSTPKFIADIAAGAEGARKGLQAIGDSVTTSLVPAFGALSNAAGPFLTQLGTEIANVVTEFSNWVLQGEKTGKLQTFFDNATAAMHDLFTTGKLVAKIIGNVIDIITGSSEKKKPGESTIDQFNGALSRLNTYLSDPTNQKTIKRFLNDITGSLIAFGHAVDKIDGWASKLGGLNDKIGKSLGFQTGADAGKPAAHKAGEDIVTGVFDGGDGAFKADTHRVAAWLWDGPDSLLGKIKSGLGIASPSTVMMTVGNNIVEGLIQGMQDWFTNLTTKAGEIPGKIKDAVGDVATLLTDKGKAAVTSVGNGISSKFEDLKTKAGGIKTTVVNKLNDAGTWLTTHGKSAVDSIRNGFNNKLGDLRVTAGTAKTTVQNKLNDAGSWLVNHGKSLVDGLKRGIELAKPGLASFLGGVGDFIKAHKGPIEKDRVLLVGAGQAIMGGLISGISDQKNALAAELSDVSSLVANTAMPALTSDLASVAGSLSKSATLEARWADGMTGDPFLDAIRRSVKFGYQGSVQAALGSA
jgi:phage-related protein